MNIDIPSAVEGKNLIKKNIFEVTRYSLSLALPPSFVTILVFINFSLAKLLLFWQKCPTESKQLIRRKNCRFEQISNGGFFEIINSLFVYNRFWHKDGFTQIEAKSAIHSPFIYFQYRYFRYEKKCLRISINSLCKQNRHKSFPAKMHEETKTHNTNTNIVNVNVCASFSRFSRVRDLNAIHFSKFTLTMYTNHFDAAWMTKYASRCSIP